MISYLAGVVILGVSVWHFYKRDAIPGIVLGCVGLVAVTSYPILAVMALSQELARQWYSPFGLFALEAERFRTSVLSSSKYADPLRLNRFEATIFSQAGEDGIVRQIFTRLGTTNKTYAEFGSGDGTENNTVFLLTQGWRGLWIDGDKALVESAQSRFAQEVSEKRLTIMREFVTAENIEGLFEKAKLPREFDLLSIDIDRNDYWVWRSITRFRPRVVVMEYNGIFPPDVHWIVPYDPNAWWDSTSHSGASLAAMEALGREKGYRLVGCTLSGINAFFVREELAKGRFCEPFTSENHYEPPRLFLINHSLGHPRRVK